MSNLIIAQSGGPTAAINATLLGVIQKAVTSGKIDKIYGALHGIKGLLAEEIIDLGPMMESTENMTLLSHTPAAALGSCRYKLKGDPEEYGKIISILKKYGAGYFVYIGGNDSMDTVAQLSKYCRENGIDDIKVMGAPKTVDNDLCETDHTPGFGSAAKYIATTFAEIYRDISVYDMPAVTIVEVMGRHAGWLTAASCLAGINGQGAPGLVYIPEIPLTEEDFISHVQEKLKESPYLCIAISEGIKGPDGVLYSEKQESKGTDAFGHKMLSGAGKYLERLISRDIGCKVRSIELNLMQRCAGHIVSATDIEESKLLGQTALDRALNGVSGEMAAIRRVSDKPYKVVYESVSIDKVANNEKLVPRDWMNEKGNHVNQKMIDYLYPLIQGECNIQYKNGIPMHFTS